MEVASAEIRSLFAVEERLGAIHGTLLRTATAVERLVAIEEQRIEMEQTLALALQPTPSAPQMPNWFVQRDGRYGVYEADGTARPATADEAVVIASQVTTRRRAR